MSYGVGYPFGQLELADLVVPPPHLLPIPSLLTGGAAWETKSLDALQALINNSEKIPVLSTLFCLQIQNAAPYEQVEVAKTRVKITKTEYTEVFIHFLEINYSS